MPDDPTASSLWPADNSAVAAHINLLQGIINRLANNSASCKTWCLTLVAALLGLAGATRAPTIVGFALVPVVIFGFIDTMYLAQEKAYRDLYSDTVKRVRDRSYSQRDLYQASAARNLCHVGKALVSWSIWPVYGGLIAAYIVAALAGWTALIGAAAK